LLEHDINLYAPKFNLIPFKNYKISLGYNVPWLEDAQKAQASVVEVHKLSFFNLCLCWHNFVLIKKCNMIFMNFILIMFSTSVQLSSINILMSMVLNFLSLSNCNLFYASNAMCVSCIVHEEAYVNENEV